MSGIQRYGRFLMLKLYQEEENEVKQMRFVLSVTEGCFPCFVFNNKVFSILTENFQIKPNPELRVRRFLHLQHDITFFKWSVLTRRFSFSTSTRRIFTASWKRKTGLWISFQHLVSLFSVSFYFNVENNVTFRQIWINVLDSNYIYKKEIHENCVVFHLIWLVFI